MPQGEPERDPRGITGLSQLYALWNFDIFGCLYSIEYLFCESPYSLESLNLIS
jgi:hypothetical protein